MKTLMIYASKYGTAEKCSDLIGKEINGEKDIINLKNEKINSIDEYNTVIILGAVYAGRIRKEITNFIREYEQDLINKNVGILICSKEKKTAEYINANFPEYVSEKSFIKEHLGHSINLEKMNLLKRFLLKSIFKVKESYSKINYEKISQVIKKINEINV